LIEFVTWFLRVALDQVTFMSELFDLRGLSKRIRVLAVRSAQRLLNDLVSRRLLASATPKGPVSLRFPADSLEVLFPRLYPLA
jgi:hypothetical protein